MNSNQTILVVDDEADIRNGVCRWLNASGFETVCAADGDLAIQSARCHAPAAILMDVLMPQKDGMTALAELRADLATSRIPVIMLSASLRDECRALDAGATYFIHKPYSGRQLIAAVKSAITNANHVGS